MFSPSLLTRRQALRQTVFFSAAAVLSRGLRTAEAEVLPNRMPATGDLNFLMLGDFGVQVVKASLKPTKQAEVSAAMQAYLQARNLRPDGMFLMGDNFYGSFRGGVDDPRWKTGFEEMYPTNIFPGPCWAMLGNHDYNEDIGIKLEAQLAYSAARPGTRWTFPSKWYRIDYPKVNPVMTVLVLDSNYLNNKQSLTLAERAAQLAWLKTELGRPRTAPFLLCMGHHPLYSNGPHGDHKHLIAEWGPLFQNAGVAAYFCGHDHDLQHLEFAGQRTSFVVSGGGGAHTTKMKKAGRGPWAETANGFTHLQINRQRMLVQHLDENQRLLHAFSRSVTGQVEILASVPPNMKNIEIDRPSTSLPPGRSLIQDFDDDKC